MYTPAPRVHCTDAGQRRWVVLTTGDCYIVTSDRTTEGSRSGVYSPVTTPYLTILWVTPTIELSRCKTQMILIPTSQTDQHCHYLRHRIARKTVHFSIPYTLQFTNQLNKRKQHNDNCELKFGKLWEYQINQQSTACTQNEAQWE